MKSARLLLCALGLGSAASAQGPLTPPGAPGPSMKSLTEISDQIAALPDGSRTVITTAPFGITTPGSYVLGANLSVSAGNGITISTDNVTLDLNGCTISSTANPAGGDAIRVFGGRTCVTIRNGHLRGATTQSGSVFTPGGFNRGISLDNTTSRSIVISGIHVAGMAGDGIYTFSATAPVATVERCSVSVCGSTGIFAHTVTDSIATECGGGAISATEVRDCTGDSAGTDSADYGIVSVNVHDSRGSGVGGGGINATGVVADSRGSSMAGVGLAGFEVSNSIGVSNTGTGLLATGNAINCYGSTTTGSIGLTAAGTASFCRGFRNGGTAISAATAIGCTVSGTGTVTATQKFLGTP